MWWGTGGTQIPCRRPGSAPAVSIPLDTQRKKPAARRRNEAPDGFGRPAAPPPGPTPKNARQRPGNRPHRVVRYNLGAAELWGSAFSFRHPQAPEDSESLIRVALLAQVHLQVEWLAGLPRAGTLVAGAAVVKQGLQILARGAALGSGDLAHERGRALADVMVAGSAFFVMALPPQRRPPGAGCP